MLVRFGLKGALHFRDYIRNILHFNRVDLHILRKGYPQFKGYLPPNSRVPPLISGVPTPNFWDTYPQYWGFLWDQNDQDSNEHTSR